MKLNRVFIGCCVAIFAQQYAMAVIPLTAESFGPLLSQPLEQAKTKIQAATAQTSQTIMQSTQNVIAAIHSTGSETAKATLSSASKSSADNTMAAQIQAKLEMDYKAQIEAMRQKDLNKLIQGETAASVEFIEKFLRKDDIKNLNINQVIDFSKKQLDGKATVVEPFALDKPCAKGDKECAKNKIRLKNVGFQRTINPSKHIEVYAGMCAEEKKQKVLNDAKTKSLNMTNIESAKKTQKSLDVTNSKEAQAKRVREQASNNCTPDSVKYGLCGKITKTDYIEKVLKNEIIPSGGVSASNFYAPSSVGGAGIVNLNNPALQKMAKAIEFDSLAKTSGGKKGLPPIVQTYRNSAQLKSAENFVDNIVNLDAVSNQPVDVRKKESSMPFQSMFMSRVSQLELARSTLNESLAERRGQKLSSINPDNLHQGEIIKESEDGAGALDIKWNQIQEDMNKVSPSNISKLTAMSDNQIWLEMYKTLVKKNEAQFDRLMRMERQSLLLAALLSSQVNSPQNIKYFKQMNQ